MSGTRRDMQLLQLHERVERLEAWVVDDAELDAPVVKPRLTSVAWGPTDIRGSRDDDGTDTSLDDGTDTSLDDPPETPRPVEPRSAVSAGASVRGGHGCRS